MQFSDFLGTILQAYVSGALALTFFALAGAYVALNRFYYSARMRRMRRNRALRRIARAVPYSLRPRLTHAEFPFSFVTAAHLRCAQRMRDMHNRHLQARDMPDC
jgi:hypothetical protein